jgi:hypothetical protein
MDALDPVERGIADAVMDIPSRARREQWKSDKRWTIEIMTALGRLGRTKGYDVCTSSWRLDDGHCWGEWLYDLTWVVMRDGVLAAVPLVLECEWSLNREAGIDPDFQKLLLARAARRVMIFQQPSRPAVEEVVSRLHVQIGAFGRTQSADRYLLFGFDWETTGEFTQRLIVTS